MRRVIVVNNVILDGDSCPAAPHRAVLAANTQIHLTDVERDVAGDAEPALHQCRFGDCVPDEPAGRGEGPT